MTSPTHYPVWDPGNNAPVFYADHDHRVQAGAAMREIGRSQKDNDRPAVVEQVNQSLQIGVFEPEPMVSQALQAGHDCLWLRSPYRHAAKGLR